MLLLPQDGVHCQSLVEGAMIKKPPDGEPPGGLNALRKDQAHGARARLLKDLA